MDTIEAMKARIQAKAESIVARVAVGDKFTVRLDKKTTVTGIIKSARVDRVRVFGNSGDAVFGVTLVLPNGKDRELFVSRLPTVR